MIVSFNIVAKTFVKIAKMFSGLSGTIIATRKRLQKVNLGKKVNSQCYRKSMVNKSTEDDISNRRMTLQMTLAMADMANDVSCLAYKTRGAREQ